MVVGHGPAPRAQAFRSFGGVSRYRGVETFELEVRGHELDGLVVDEVLLVLGKCEDGLQEPSVRQHSRLHMLERILKTGPGSKQDNNQSAISCYALVGAGSNSLDAGLGKTPRAASPIS